jgi:hypothetical protein
VGGTLDVVVDASTPIPGGTGETFGAFDGSPSLDNSDVVFIGGASVPGFTGVYIDDGIGGITGSCGFDGRRPETSR